MQPSALHLVKAVVVLAAWGALAFGAVYPWAYRPLVVGAFVTGVLALVAARRDLRTAIPPALAIGLGLIVVSIGLQLVPLPARAMSELSPAAHALLQRADLTYGAGEVGRHSLSVSPERTALALAFAVSLASLLLGTATILPQVGAKRFCAAIVGLGTVLALVGIVQKPLYAGRIYGFWEPLFEGNPFGPFVNKNHFAGWMVMALSLSLGYYAGRIAAVRRDARSSFRDRVLWLSSSDANQLFLIGICLAVMALSLVLTLSRSGITCLAIAVVLTGIVAATKSGARSRRAAIVGYAGTLFAVAIWWAGSEVVAQRFASADWSEFNNRLGAWKDAWQIAMRFMPFGSGLNTYGSTTLLYQSSDVAHHYVEAHNDYLQLAAEGGLLVGIPVAITVAAFGHAILRRFRRGEDDVLTGWIRMGALTGIVAIALQEVAEFSLQIPGNAVLFTVLAAIAVHKPAPVQKRVRREARREVAVGG